jgi:Tfp pilus assembly protein PilF
MIGLITNDWDRDNLNFLLNASPETMADWESQCDEDDRVYAQELLDAYAEELRLQAHDLLIEGKMALMMEYKDAESVLKKFAL